MSEKKSLEEKIINLKQKRTGWIEPIREWIKEAENMAKIARENNLFAKKVMAKKIFGSNLLLTGGKVILKEGENGKIQPQKHWTAIKAAHEKIGIFLESCILVVPRGVEPRLPG